MLIGEKQHKNLLRFACDQGGEREQGELGQEKSVAAGVSS